MIVGLDGAAWVTEGGQNAIARVDPATHAVKPFPLPKERRNANLNTATFDRQGILWFTGQNGVYGRLDPKSGAIVVFDAPRGIGPYGIATTADGQVFFASLAGNYLGQIASLSPHFGLPIPQRAQALIAAIGARYTCRSRKCVRVGATATEAVDHRPKQRRSIPLRQ